jgi:hypothetical protein
MLQCRRDRFERAHQVAQHMIVDRDLLLVAPAVDEIGLFIERRVDQMRGALELACHRGALRRVGEVERDVTRAVEIARLTPRQRHNLRAADCAEVPQGGVADETGGTGHYDFLVCHFIGLPNCISRPD